MKVIGFRDDRDQLSERNAADCWILQKVIIPGGSPAGGNHARVDLLHDRLREGSAIASGSILRRRPAPQLEHRSSRTSVLQPEQGISPDGSY
jgi:hypothetical protein